MSIYKGAASEGSRAENLLKAREREKEEMELQRSRISQQSERLAAPISSKFSTTVANEVEVEAKVKTYGLVTLEELKAHQEALEAERERRVAALVAKEGPKKKAPKKRAKVVLSFDIEEEGEEEDGCAVRAPAATVGAAMTGQTEDDVNGCNDNGNGPSAKKLKKNPNVDTSFLPDRDREELDRQERERLRQGWVQRQEEMKKEQIDITYSYWDGSGHRKQVTMHKGDTIEKFLHECLVQLRKEFHEVRAVSTDQLMYIKEDLIIPHYYTFYDFIVTKARGKSGPLFSFDVHEDVRMVHDASVEKDESHAGKIVLRNWYERHKHIFPASRWEPYDPEKKWDTYTISDKNKKDDQ